MLPDPREHGSGNPGATNVLRIGGRLAAAAVLVFDILKGMLPVWLAYKLDVPPLYLGLTAIAAARGTSIRCSSTSAAVAGVATAFGAIAPIGWDLTGLMTGTAADGAAQRLLFARRHRQRADRPVLRLVVQTAVHLPGGDALMPDPDAASRQYPAPVARPEGKIWGKFRKKKTVRMRITATSRKTNNRRAGLSGPCFIPQAVPPAASAAAPKRSAPGWRALQAHHAGIGDHRAVVGAKFRRA